MGRVWVYDFDGQKVPVTLDIECDNGETFKDSDTMNVEKRSFGHLHVSTMTGVPPPDRCRGISLDTCLENIEAQYAFHADKIQEQFDQCVGEQKSNFVLTITF